MINQFLATLPSTNFRIFVTLFVTVATAARYLASGVGLQPGGIHIDTWEPSWEWLLFLAAMAGIDLAQFHLKRKSHMETTPTLPDPEDANALREKETKGGT